MLKQTERLAESNEGRMALAMKMFLVPDLTAKQPGDSSSSEDDPFAQQRQDVNEI